MCSTPGLPTPGSNITIHFTRINLHPYSVIVELWGQFDQERKVEYQRLRREIQTFPKTRFGNAEGSPGDLCLVQIIETWYRARILVRKGRDYHVFLIDEGRTLDVVAYNLAHGRNDFFHLPPEVEFCILANVVPLSTENKWSPMALEFLKSLGGKSVDGCVQDVLLPHRTFLLDVPCVSKQMFEMGFAKRLSNKTFKLFVERSMQSMTTALSNQESQQLSLSIRSKLVESGDVPEKDLGINQDYFYPQLQSETTEAVVVTELINPLRFFCQLRIFSHELKKLTEHMSQFYEGRSGLEKTIPEVLGSPCAARGKDGRWYRSIVQQVLSSSNVVEVLHVDYGRKELIPFGGIRSLAAEYFRMPVVTYLCSLLGLSDHGVGWSTAQMENLKSLILHRVVNAKFEYHSYSEGVYYVTLYGDESLNINLMLGMRETCLSETKENPLEGQITGETFCLQPQALGQGDEPASAVHSTSVANMYNIKTESLGLGCFYDAVVEFVTDPSEFWIRTQDYAIKFDQMMGGIREFYTKATQLEGIVKTLKTGLYCIAKAKDGLYYRAVIRKLHGHLIEVDFVDYGNTEIVDRYDLKILPSKFQELPSLAVKCRLSDIQPIGGKWSKNAVTHFIKIVADKVLMIQVSAKHQDEYVIELIDRSVDGEKCVNKLMCSAGYAEYEETEKAVTKFTRIAQPCLAVQTQSEKTDHCKLTRGPPPVSSGIPTSGCETRSVFKETLFPIGSSVEVNVSCIESPNDFWCQLSESAGSLALLMEEIQEYYMTRSDPYKPGEVACIARHAHDGRWYRAYVIRKIPASLEVDVLHIDFGNTEKVSLKDLRAINPAFLRLKGQAFRCSLYNLIQPVAQDPLHWNERAVFQFQEFVDNAATACLELTCTIYAVMYDSNKVVFNVVDLETQFQSICNLLVQKGLARCALPKKAPQPPFHLDTYYYSTHNIKTGGEEEIYATHIKNVGNFYCQLGRNADIVHQLAEKVNYLCEELQRIDCPKTFGTVCFAKYSDGHWYRGQIQSVEPTIQVFFVDYGDTQVVEKSDLLPVPIEASDIMSVPIQAVVCGLSDIPVDVPKKVNEWFENAIFGKTLKAIVVAKESDGKLIVELYNENSQINANIKEKLAVQSLRQERLSIEVVETKFRNAQELTLMRKETTPTFKSRDEYKARLSSQIRESKSFSGDSGVVWTPDRVNWRPPKGEQKHLISSPKFEHNKKIAPSNQQMDNTSPSSGPAHDWEVCSLKESAVVNVKTGARSLPNLGDLPPKCIELGEVKEVYVSHSNCPSSFFVQLVQDEDEIYSVVEKLNADQLVATNLDADRLQPEDLVCAEFPDDGSWYRAVLKNKLEDGTLNVEFLDFGNTATIDSTRVRLLSQEFIKIPRLSIHCLLSGVESANTDGEWGQDSVLQFKMATGENEGIKKLTCEFMKQSGLLWEVNLLDQQNVVADYLVRSGFAASRSVIKQCVQQKSGEAVSKGLASVPENKMKEPEMEQPALQYSRCVISPGQSLYAYASSVVGPGYFWCQSANSDILQRIAEMADSAGSNPEETGVCVDFLRPGNPCLALFTEDEHWYRAEIKRIHMDVLSIIFVDYGNEVDVNQELLKLVPAEFFEIPMQAFLCILEGFDLSAGCWDVGAADKFITLLSDQLLKVSVLKCEEDNHGDHLFHVKVESNEVVVNDIMRNYWKMHTEERKEYVNTEHEQQQTIADMLVANEVCPPEEKSELQRRIATLSNAEKLHIGTDEQSIHFASKKESFTLDETGGDADMVGTTYEAVDHDPQACAQKPFLSVENSDLSTIERNTELFGDAGKIQTGTLEDCNLQSNTESTLTQEETPKDKHTVEISNVSQLPSVDETGDDVPKTFTVEEMCKVVSTVQRATEKLQTDEQSANLPSNADTAQDVTVVKELSIKLSNAIECEKVKHDVQDVDRVSFEENVNNPSRGEICPREVTKAEQPTLQTVDLFYQCKTSNFHPLKDVQKIILFEESEYLESNTDELSLNNDLSSNGGETCTQEENCTDTNTVEINDTMANYPKYDHAFLLLEDIQERDSNVRETSNACHVLNRSLTEHSCCKLYDVDQQCCIVDGNVELLVSRDQVEGKDIHEENLRQLVGLDSAAEVVDSLVLDTEIKGVQNQQSDPHGCEPDFIGLKLETEDELGVGSDCVVWAYVSKTWCKAQILKVYDETTKIRLPPEVNRILYIRNLPYKITAEEMYDIFGKYGPIRQIRVGNTAESRGTAYVVYEDIFDAKNACDHLSGFNVCNRYLVVLYYNANRAFQKMDTKKKEEQLKLLKEKYGINTDPPK
ncbi:Tudor domain-containing protein 6 [Acipenser ruthenus]|uniref:Splicing factor 3B subunit 6 n=2 Tax=Acipenseroidei TaxID=186622 RepID=A0A662YV47_ACIRT|nr:Tudor domain-containing protein 6 [Acipenser ruthenus]